jgi:hypothetical protein
MQNISLEEFIPEVWIEAFIKQCYFDARGVDLDRLCEMCSEVVYEITPIFIDYEIWMAYSDADRLKMRKMWSRYTYKLAHKLLGR